jgi:predicted enzyme related to lactoylglutathione lyase
MKRMVEFFEIPAADFERAVKFYEVVFNVKLSTFDCDTEKMAFFPNEDGKAPGAISFAEGFDPSKNGILISFRIDNMDEAISKIEKGGGKITRQKTKIESENRGYFATFLDSEGNQVGLYSDK